MACKLLEAMGQKQKAEALLADRRAMEALALKPSDRVIEPFSGSFPNRDRPAKKAKKRSSNNIRVEAMENRQQAPRRDQTENAVKTWIIPYIDQPPEFWQEIRLRFFPFVQGVYLPLREIKVPTGRPPQQADFLNDFLRTSPLPFSLLVNPVILPEPADKVAPALIKKLKSLRDRYGLQNVTVADYTLARRIKEKLPEISLTASVLMGIDQPHQATLLNGICETLVPASRIMRNYQRLEAIRQAFNGKIRLIVNEACLPDCLFRTQHFYEMATFKGLPKSLCEELLIKEPWLRLTGAWVLPQHLHLFMDVVDELKLAGRVTLKDPKKYLNVLQAYVTGRPLSPDAIGGGPASVLTPVPISEEFYRKTLFCGQQCHACKVCREYFANVVSAGMPEGK